MYAFDLEFMTFISPGDRVLGGSSLEASLEVFNNSCSVKTLRWSVVKENKGEEGVGEEDGETIGEE
jgi:hypothetical protein